MAPSVFSDLIQRVRTRASLERLKSRSSSSRPSPVERKRSTASTYSYSSYSVHQQPATPAMLRHDNVTSRILDHVAEAPGGKRVLTKLARTCKSLFEPAADALWKELDSLVPLIGLFPSHLLRRSKRPGLGLAKVPEEEDWDRVLSYGDRVHKITYNESMYNVAPNVFPIIDEYRPRLYILPNLQTLIWRCETPAGLERSLLFLSPHLQHLVLDIGMRIPNLDLLIGELPKRTKLSTLSISSITPLPDNFTQAMSEQRSLESLSLSVPGALTPALGRWIASLPKLRRLQLDLTARSFASIEAFFQGIDSPSGYLTPTSLGATDNDIFSGGEELDFDSRKDRRRNSRHISGDCPAVRFTRPGAGFLQLEEVQLTGDAGTLAAFLKHLPGEVATLELIVDDPPERLDWKDLWLILNERFPDSLHTIRISPTSASRPELLRSLSRGEHPAITPQLLALPVENFPNLPHLRKLDVDLPHSVIIVNADVEALAISCPALEVLRLCPTARFPITSDAPRLTLDGLAPLTRYCTRLHTLAVVLSALPQRDDVPESQMHSSPSLLRLNVGHSWLKDPLQTAILLSHLAPHLRVLRYFHEANRPGYVAAHASAWQQVTLFLPRLQRLRAVERKASQDALDRLVRARQEPDQPPTPVHEQDFTAHPLNAVLERDHRGPGSRESDAVGCLIPALAEKVDKAVDAALPDQMIHSAAVMVDAAVQTVQMLPDSHATVIPLDVSGARDVPSVVIVEDRSIISGQDVIQTRVLVSEPVPDPDAPTAAGDDRRVRQPQRRPLTVAVAAPNLLASLDKLSGVRAKAARSDVLPARPSSLSIREVFFCLPLYLGLLLLNTALRLMGARLSRTLSSAKPSSHSY